MKFFAIAALFVASAIAVPTNGYYPPPNGGGNPGRPGNGGGNPGRPGNGGGSGPLCPAGLYSNPQCCATDVLGIAALDCSNPRETPRSGSSLRSICAAEGQEAKCCAIPVAGQALLCTNPLN
ncbi:Trihydrophobin [Cladobotryum mycophilum]|uniref:Trihydrophobin n=1 Tax=Cladobotryum mycophilum TaxID=491253 RepID=A0ABR0SVQ8_9HYPO